MIDKQKMIRQREKKERKLAARQWPIRDKEEQENLDFLVECLGIIHRNVFGSELTVINGSRQIKAILTAQDFFCTVAFDPPADCIPGHILPVSHSMFFAGILKNAPMVDGKIWHGIYAVNLDPFFNVWLARIEEKFPGVSDDKRAAIERANIVQLLAHEIRHEVQFFSKPNRHKIVEIKDIRPEVFSMWQNRTLSVFKHGWDQDMIDRDEDALVVELLVQQLCINCPMVDEVFFQKIGQLVKE